MDSAGARAALYFSRGASRAASTPKLASIELQTPHVAGHFESMNAWCSVADASQWPAAAHARHL